MMKELTRHDLEFNLTWLYVKNNIEDLTAFSIELLKLLDFKMGSFFTLLPFDADLKQLYKFSEAGILSQNEKIPFSKTEKLGSYEYIPDIKQEISNVIFNEIVKNNHLIGLFEDHLRSPDDPYYIFNGVQKLTYVYKKEIYYITNLKSTQNQISRCLDKANAIWHSLCVLTKVNLRDPNEEELTLEDLQEASKNAQMIIVGAYDGEGYVFWERNE